ncbi:MAG: kinase, partial [Lachnospiraceae bacterium]|nr:kinase [Lachnospiraceae bacterium]
NPIIIAPERKQQLNRNLMLFFTGFSRFSSDIQAGTQKAMVDKQAQLLEMLSLVDDAENVLTSKSDLNEFGRLLDYTWRLKRGISSGISTDSIDGLYAKGMEAGALGGKLLGAGGGGFLLFYVEEDKQEMVRKAMSDLLYVPFEFENSGTRVIHYTPEIYEKR